MRPRTRCARPLIVMSTDTSTGDAIRQCFCVSSHSRHPLRQSDDPSVACVKKWQKIARSSSGHLNPLYFCRSCMARAFPTPSGCHVALCFSSTQTRGPFERSTRAVARSQGQTKTSAVPLTLCPTLPSFISAKRPERRGSCESHHRSIAIVNSPFHQPSHQFSWSASIAQSSCFLLSQSNATSAIAATVSLASTRLTPTPFVPRFLRASVSHEPRRCNPAGFSDISGE